MYIMQKEIRRSSQKYLGLQPSGVKNELVLQILRLEAEVELEQEAHPAAHELRPWCRGTMLDILLPSNVAPVVEGGQPTQSYQPLGGSARTATHTKAARCPRRCRYLSARQACIVA